MGYAYDDYELAAGLLGDALLVMVLFFELVLAAALIILIILKYLLYASFSYPLIRIFQEFLNLNILSVLSKCVFN